MVTKRGHIDLDPDYEDVTERQTKRQRVLVEDGMFMNIIKQTSSVIRSSHEIL